MYAWIWRRLPFGTAGKLIGSLLLVAAAAALLWYLVFPAVDPHLPYDDGRVSGRSATTNQDDVVPASPSPTR